MKITGHCYCGDIAYECDGEAVMQFQCHCRECQYITGGMPNAVMGLPEAGFRYTKGKPAQFSRSDIDDATTREFCGKCGTPLASLSSKAPGLVLVKVGSLDKPQDFAPQAVLYTCDKQPFHQLPENVPSFEKVPS